MVIWRLPSINKIRILYRMWQTKETVCGLERVCLWAVFVFTALIHYEQWVGGSNKLKNPDGHVARPPRFNRMWWHTLKLLDSFALTKKVREIHGCVYRTRPTSLPWGRESARCTHTHPWGNWSLLDSACGDLHSMKYCTSVLLAVSRILRLREPLVFDLGFSSQALFCPKA